jgi:hypothetical protein
MAAVSIDFQLAAPREPISDCCLLGLEIHLVAKSLQSSDRFDLCLLAVDAIKVITATLFVFDPFAQHLVQQLYYPFFQQFCTHPLVAPK